MRRRAVLALAVLVVATGVSGIASAHQTWNSDLATKTTNCGIASAAKPNNKLGVPQVVSVGDQVYLDTRYVASNGYSYSIWVYVESNGHPGMQTVKNGGPSPLFDDDFEVCTNSATAGWGHTTLTKPDTLIY